MLSAQVSLTLRRYPNASKERSFINKVITLLDSMEPQLLHVGGLLVHAADENRLGTPAGAWAEVALHLLKKNKEPKKYMPTPCIEHPR